MLSFDITPATIVIGLLFIMLAIFAIRRLVRRGTCDCRDHCGDASEGCPGCGSVDKMISDMERATKDA